MTEIDHAQVWTTLQLIHAATLLPYEQGVPVLLADTDQTRLVYVPLLRARDARKLRAAVKAAPTGSSIVYTWQPGLVEAKLADLTGVEVAAVPGKLATRFGIGT